MKSKKLLLNTYNGLASYSYFALEVDSLKQTASLTMSLGRCLSLNVTTLSV